MTSKEHRQALENFFGFRNEQNPIYLSYLVGDIDEALFAVSKARLWPDGAGSVSPQQAVMCWLIVEKLKSTAFPGSLKP